MIFDYLLTSKFLPSDFEPESDVKPPNFRVIVNNRRRPLNQVIRLCNHTENKVLTIDLDLLLKQTIGQDRTTCLLRSSDLRESAIDCDHTTIKESVTSAKLIMFGQYCSSKSTSGESKYRSLCFSFLSSSAIEQVNNFCNTVIV